MTAHHRLEERKDLCAILEAGESPHLLGPRRLGKTWLMQALRDDLRAAKWRVIYRDVEGLPDEKDFLRALCQDIEQDLSLKTSIMKHIGERWKAVVGGKKFDSLIQILADVDHRQMLEALISALSEQEENTAILIDEISLFVKYIADRSPEDARNLLYHLRYLRQNYPKVRWFFTGSVGLNVVAERLQLGGALIDLHIFPLEPFTAEQARSYLAECNKALIFSEPAFDALVQELGWLSPYYLKHIIGKIRVRAPVEVSEEDIKKAFEALLKPDYKGYFAAYEEHIRKNFVPEDTSRLRAILDFCCETPNGEEQDTLLSYLGRQGLETTKATLRSLLDALEADGLLTRDDKRWRFRSGLVRRYWEMYQK